MMTRQLSGISGQLVIKVTEGGFSHRVDLEGYGER